MSLKAKEDLLFLIHVVNFAIGVLYASAKGKFLLRVCSLLGPDEHSVVRSCFRVTGIPASDLWGGPRKEPKDGCSAARCLESQGLSHVSAGDTVVRGPDPLRGTRNPFPQLPEGMLHSGVLPRN